VPSQLAVTGVPPGFDAWFARACCREVDERFQTAKELAEALRLVLAPDLDRGSASISLSVLASAVGGAASTAVTVQAPAAISPKPAPSGAVAANTVPGMSLATASGSKRSAGVYAAAALGFVMLGSGVTWLALTGRLGARAAMAPTAATAAMIATAVPSVTSSPAPTAEAAGPAAAPPPPTVTPASSAHDPTPTATATASATASARATKPPRGAPPPPRRGGGDGRLAF
jgi:serine/threonine-protein kinase